MNTYQETLFEEQKRRLMPLLLEIAKLGGPFDVAPGPSGVPAVVTVEFRMSDEKYRFTAHMDQILPVQDEAAVLLALIEDAQFRAWAIEFKPKEKVVNDQAFIVNLVSFKHASTARPATSLVKKEGVVAPAYLMAEEWLGLTRANTHDLKYLPGQGDAPGESLGKD